MRVTFEIGGWSGEIDTNLMGIIIIGVREALIAEVKIGNFLLLQLFSRHSDRRKRTTMPDEAVYEASCEKCFSRPASILKEETGFFDTQRTRCCGANDWP